MLHAGARGHGREEAPCGLLSAGHRTGNDVARGDTGLVVEGRVRLVINGDRRAVERQSREHAAAARVGVDLSLEGRIRGGRGLTSHRSRGDRGIGAEGHLAAVDALHALGRGEHQDDVGRLHAPLPAEASAGHRDEHRVGEVAFLVPQDQHTVATAAAGEERDLGHVGEHGDTVGTFEQAIRYRLVARGAQLLEDLARHQQAALFARLRLRAGGGDREHDTGEQTENTGAGAHVEIPS